MAEKITEVCDLCGREFNERRCLRLPIARSGEAAAELVTVCERSCYMAECGKSWDRAFASKLRSSFEEHERKLIQLRKKKGGKP